MNLDALVGVILAGIFVLALGALFLAGLTVKFMLWLISVTIAIPSTIRPATLSVGHFFDIIKPCRQRPRNSIT